MLEPSALHIPPNHRSSFPGIEHVLYLSCHSPVAPND